jgi:simple sugar transport system permease protein
MRQSLLTLVAAFAAGLLAFGLFVALIGQSPLAVYATLYEGGFGSAFAWQDTLLRASPLILTGLAVAIPAQAGLMVIGAEGALALGGLGAAAIAVAAVSMGLHGPAWLLQALALLAGVVVGGAWLGLVGVLRTWRGLNETIGSLLLSFVAVAIFNHLVEGPLRDPASLNKPSTRPLPADLMLGNLPGLDVHWGLAFGVVAALIAQIVLSRTTWGFALRITGGNQRVARMAGLRVSAWLVAACACGGAAAGMAGALEVLAVHGTANASLLVGYGTTGILVAFLARQQPLACVPVAVLMGGIGAAGSLLQRRLDLPDATTQVLQGMLFVSILTAETLNGRSLRWPWRRPASTPAATPAANPAATGATASPAANPVAAVNPAVVPALAPAVHRTATAPAPGPTPGGDTVAAR